MSWSIRWFVLKCKNKIFEKEKSMNSEEKKLKKKITIKDILFLQGIVMIYTLSSVAAKYASGTEFLSTSFIWLYGLEIALLGVYAILWQQVIKKMDLSIAYANRAIALLWSMIWAVLFFRESITKENNIGVMIVIVGTIIVNSDGDE